MKPIFSLIILTLLIPQNLFGTPLNKETIREMPQKELLQKAEELENTAIYLVGHGRQKEKRGKNLTAWSLIMRKELVRRNGPQLRFLVPMAQTLGQLGLFQHQLREYSKAVSSYRHQLKIEKHYLKVTKKKEGDSLQKIRQNLAYSLIANNNENEGKRLLGLSHQYFLRKYPSPTSLKHLGYYFGMAQLKEDGTPYWRMWELIKEMDQLRKDFSPDPYRDSYAWLKYKERVQISPACKEAIPVLLEMATILDSLGESGQGDDLRKRVEIVEKTIIWDYRRRGQSTR